MSLSMQHIVWIFITCLAGLNALRFERYLLDQQSQVIDTGPYQWSAWTPWSNCNGTCDKNAGHGLTYRTRLCYHKTNFALLEHCQTPYKDDDDDYIPFVNEVETYSLVKRLLNTESQMYIDYVYKTCNAVGCPGNHDVLCVLNSLTQQDGKLNDKKNYSTFAVLSKEHLVDADKWSDWTEYGACSKSCGVGVQYRQRQCVNPSLNCSGNPQEFRVCTEALCPVDGGWSAWTGYGECSSSCGNGVQYRNRQCNYPAPQYGGQNCTGSSLDFKSCSKGLCPVDGGWSDFKPTQCSVTCGIGVLTYFRTCTNPSPVNGGKNCSGPSHNFTHCKIRECAVDGSWTSWNDWSPCPVSSGTSLQTRVRHCNNPVPNSAGKNCTGDAVESKLCLVNTWSGWSQWNKCSVTCGSGISARTRTCLSSNDCTGDSIEYGPCTMPECLNVDGAWGTWADWTECSRSCGNGTQTRTRLCDSPIPLYGGRSCKGNSLETQGCLTKYCSIDGGWSDFNIISCSVTCGRGQQVDVRYCTNPAPQYGGKDCDGLSHQITECFRPPCAVDGNWSQWSQFSKCDSVCGDGYTLRNRTCSSPAPENSGNICAGESEQRLPCNNGPCPIGKR